MSKISDKINIRKIIAIIAGAILFNWALQNISTIFTYLGKTVNVFFPFILGLCIAFILNVPMQAIEGRLHIKKKSIRRGVSILLTIVIVILVILLVMLIVIPEIWQTLQTMTAKLPAFIDRLTDLLKNFSDKLPNLSVWLSDMKVNWDNIGKTVFNFLQKGVTGTLNSTIAIASSVFSGVSNLVLGLVFAIYILFQKESLGTQSKKLIYAYLLEKRADKVISICSLVNKTFSRFITGQCTEAVILGLMFFIAMVIFRFPYALVIAVLVTCTALIPIFGAFIACFIGAFLILITSPVKALWFLVMFLILQQIEGNIIYPRVVGGSLGLPGLWVMLAVLIGGSTMGVTGMLIGVPLCSVLYILLKESIGMRLAKKHISKEKVS